MSTPRTATSERDEVRTVAPKLIEMTEKVVYGDVWERARKVFEGARS